MLARIRKTNYSHRLPHLLKPELFIGGSCGCAVRLINRLYTLCPPPTLRQKLEEEAALLLPKARKIFDGMPDFGGDAGALAEAVCAAVSVRSVAGAGAASSGAALPGAEEYT